MCIILDIFFCLLERLFHILNLTDMSGKCDVNGALQ